jgi:hypothetical protein
MTPSPDRAEVAEVLELFGHPTDEDAHRSLWREMLEIEHAAQRLMRTPLRPQEFAEVAALAQASKAAQAILAGLRTDR